MSTFLRPDHARRSPKIDGRRVEVEVTRTMQPSSAPPCRLVLPNSCHGPPSDGAGRPSGHGATEDLQPFLDADERTRTSTRFPGHGPEPDRPRVDGFRGVQNVQIVRFSGHAGRIGRCDCCQTVATDRGWGSSCPPPGRACLSPTFRAEAPGDLGLGGMFRPLRMLRFVC